jgi:hypothetical protein
MAQEQQCQCRSAMHAHEPGKCPNPATEADGLCKHCHDEVSAETSANSSEGSASKPSDA